MSVEGDRIGYCCQYAGAAYSWVSFALPSMNSIRPSVGKYERERERNIY